MGERQEQAAADLRRMSADKMIGPRINAKITNISHGVLFGNIQRLLRVYEKARKTQTPPDAV